MDCSELTRAFTPFLAAEIAELERYRDHVHQLADSGFANQDEYNFHTPARDGAVVSRDDKDRLVGALPYYRKLDMLEGGSFQRARNILSQHAQGGTPEGSLVAKRLRQVKQARTQVHNQSNWFGYEEVGQGAPRTIRPK